jgi:hypothetical protein
MHVNWIVLLVVIPGWCILLLIVTFQRGVGGLLNTLYCALRAELDFTTASYVRSPFPT